MIERTLLFNNQTMIPFAAALAAVLGVAIVWLYRVERHMVRPRSGIILTVLRILLLLVLLLMLVEPIISITTTRTRRGALIVMMDNSRSMQIPDRERPDYEKFRLADALGLLPEGVHRSVLASAEDALSQLVAEGGQATEHWSADYPYITRGTVDDPEDLARIYDRSLDDAHALEATLKTLLARIDRAFESRATLPPDVAAELTNLRARLASVGPDLLDEVVRELTSEEFRTSHPLDRLIGVNERFSRAAATFGEALPKLRGLVVRHDTALAKEVLPGLADVVQEIDRTTRLDLAARVLTDEHVGVLRRLGERYNIHGRLFARRSSEFPIKITEDAVSAEVAPPESTADALYTDLAENLREAVAELPGEEIGGVIIMTDGRFNHGGDPLAAARAVGVRAPIYPVVVGSEVPPRDIAVVKVAAADVVQDQDILMGKVLIQAPGFRGQPLKLVITEKGEIVSEQTFNVPETTDRTVVDITFTPEGKGKHLYVVTVPVQPREVFTRNNERTFAVTVLDRKLKVLMVEGGPRWEYRYLKNALLRDKRLDLTYILLDPVTASNEEKIRAQQAFPHDRKALFAWDTIILGDVNPENFSAEDLANLEAFVNDRGGTMIVMAGRKFMPSAYAGTAFAPVLPVVPEEDPDKYAKDIPIEGFPLRLTAEARQSVIFRLTPDETENVATWADLPRMMWFAPAKQVRPGAVIYAYAGLANGGGDEASVERKYPIIMSHAYGLGRVFYMGVDSTWRWRYKVADKYFHQFWGQVILWATSGKLPAGTDRVKLGTDKFEYVDGETVVVRARVLSEEQAPVSDAMVRATLTDKKDHTGNTRLGPQRMEYLADSGGHYETAFANVPPGRYVVTLSIPGMEDELKDINVDIEVADAPSRELVELSADPAFCQELAARGNGRAFALDELARLPDTLRPLKWTLSETEEVRLWSHWILLAFFCLVITTEWVLRKVEGLL